MPKIIIGIMLILLGVGLPVLLHSVTGDSDWYAMYSFLWLLPLTGLGAIGNGIGGIQEERREWAKLTKEDKSIVRGLMSGATSYLQREGKHHD